MPWAAAAGAAVSAVGSIGSGLIGANASEQAAKIQQEAAQQALAFQEQVYGTTTQNLSPFLKAGTGALGNLQQLLGIGPGGSGPTSPVLQMLGIGPSGQPTGGGINPATFQGSPGYQYQLQQGTNAVTNAAAPGGIGGNALRALQQTGQGLANQNFNQYLGNVGNAWQQQIGNISGLAGAGQNAAVQQGGFGQNFAAAAGSNIWGGANAAANGITGAASALGGGIAGGGQNLTALLNSPQFQSLFSGGNNGGNYISPTDLNALSTQASNNVAGGAAGL